MVTLPGGREITGRRPGFAAVTLEEHRLRDVLARQVRGICEAVLPFGRADVMTAAAVYEVETAAKWRTGVRQVLAYAAQCGLPPCLALFGCVTKKEMQAIFWRLKETDRRFGLWWWTGTAWIPIPNGSNCRGISGPVPVKTRAKTSPLPRFDPAALSPDLLKREAAKPYSVAAAWADGWELRQLERLRWNGLWVPAATSSSG